MDRTTIMLPDTLKARATKLAHEHGISFAELVRLSLESKLSSLEKGERDQLFSDRHYSNKAIPANTSVEHDKYLYE
jgi:hypothetical protein